MTSRAKTDSQEGSIIVEAVFAIFLMAALGYGALWIGALANRNQQLEKAVHATARYGARSEFAPGDGAVRRRTAAEIQAYLIQAALPVDLSGANINATITLECGAGPDEASMIMNPCTHPESQAAGTYIEVKASYRITSGDPITDIANDTNGLFGAFRFGAPLPQQITVSAASVALIE